jgi:GNAT superfamily N-acetyltransferase
MSHSPWRRAGFTIATDPATTDLDVVCSFLASSYWAEGLPRTVLERSIAGALVYNLIEDGSERQVGFARVVTDHARIAWLSDVFVLESHRGCGLGCWLVRSVMDDPRLQGVRRWVLATDDAHGLYRQFGWQDAPQGLYMTLRGG